MHVRCTLTVQINAVRADRQICVEQYHQRIALNARGKRDPDFIFPDEIRSLLHTEKTRKNQPTQLGFFRFTLRVRSRGKRNELEKQTRVNSITVRLMISHLIVFDYFLLNLCREITQFITYDIFPPFS